MPWEEVARRAADAAVKAGQAASRCEGMYIRMSAKLNEHIDEHQRAALNGHTPLPKPPRMPVDSDVEPDEITAHGTEHFRFKNERGHELVLTRSEFETLKSGAALVNAGVGAAKKWAWHHAVPWALALGLGAWHVVRALLMR